MLPPWVGPGLFGVSPGTKQGRESMPSQKDKRKVILRYQWFTRCEFSLRTFSFSYLGSSKDQDFPWVCIRSPYALGFWWSWVQGCFSSVEGPVLLQCLGSLTWQWLGNLCVWVSGFIFVFFMCHPQFTEALWLFNLLSVGCCFTSSLRWWG